MIWMYSFVSPPQHSWHSLRASESYERIHDWVRNAFAKLNVPTELSPVNRSEIPGQCFVGAERFDVLWHGKKIAGAAQRRNRLGLLIQGSVQPPPLNLARVDWQQAMCDTAVESWNVQWSAFEPDTTLNNRTEWLVRNKFSLAQYNERR